MLGVRGQPKSQTSFFESAKASKIMHSKNKTKKQFEKLSRDCDAKSVHAESMISSKSHKTLSLVSAGTWYQRLYFLPVLGKHLLVKTGICRSGRGSDDVPVL